VFNKLNELADRLYLKGEYKKAALVYKYLCKTNFSIVNLVAYCKTLIASQDRKNITMAIKLLNDVLDNIKLEDSDLIIVKRNLGNAYCNLKEYEIARVFYENCLKINNNDASTYTNIAVSYYLEQEYFKALDNFNTALNINQNHIEALSGIALVYFNNSDFKNSLLYLESAININPSNQVVINLLCKLFFEHNIKFNLKTYIENYLSFDSLNVDIIYLYAVILFKENNFKLCELELIKLLYINPEYSFAKELILFVKKRTNLYIEGSL